MRFATFVLLALIALLASTGGASAREWTDINGRTMEAEFHKLDGKVVVVLRGGRYIRIPLARLSAADQEFVRQQKVRPGPEGPGPLMPPGELGPPEGTGPAPIGEAPGPPPGAGPGPRRPGEGPVIDPGMFPGSEEGPPSAPPSIPGPPGGGAPAGNPSDPIGPPTLRMPMSGERFQFSQRPDIRPLPRWWHASFGLYYGALHAVDTFGIELIYGETRLPRTLTYDALPAKELQLIAAELRRQGHPGFADYAAYFLDPKNPAAGLGQRPSDPPLSEAMLLTAWDTDLYEGFDLRHGRVLQIDSTGVTLLIDNSSRTIGYLLMTSDQRLALVDFAMNHQATVLAQSIRHLNDVTQGSGIAVQQPAREWTIRGKRQLASLARVSFEGVEFTADKITHRVRYAAVAEEDVGELRQFLETQGREYLEQLNIAKPPILSTGSPVSGSNSSLPDSAASSPSGATTCPHCQVGLPPGKLAEGICPSCGKMMTRGANDPWYLLLLPAGVVVVSLSAVFVARKSPFE